MIRLAIVTTHPIQYYDPWFRFIAEEGHIHIKVYYLWDFGVKDREDQDFGDSIKWDIPMLEGYDYEFLTNKAEDPGTHHWRGIDNPELTSKLRADQPDAVLLMTYHNLTIYRLLLHWKQDDPPVLFRGDSHRLHRPKGLKETMKRHIISWIFSKMDAFLHVGKANRRYFQYHCIDNNRIFFSPHAIDNRRYIDRAENGRQKRKDKRKELGIPEDSKVVIFTGKFIERKRPTDLIRAFTLLKDKNIRLLMVGSGPLDNQLKNLAAEDFRIVFAGFRNQAEMPELLAASDLLVLPSRFETWGLSINEAMCARLPIITTHMVGASRDLVANGVNGYCIVHGDTETLSRRMSEILASRNTMKAMGNASFQRIQSYDYRHATDGLYRALRWLEVRNGI